MIILSQSRYVTANPMRLESTMQVNMHEAQAHLAHYVEKTLAGEEVVLARGGKVLVVFVPIEKHNNVILGILEGAFDVPENFDDNLPEGFYKDFLF